MNESTVTFWQVLMFLQIRLAIKMMHLEATWVAKLTRLWASFSKRQYTGFRKGLYWMLKWLKGEKK